MVRSLQNKIYLVKRFFGIKIDPSKDLEENLDNFRKLNLDLENFKQKFADERKEVILLSSPPESFKEVRNAIEYARDTLTSDILVNSIRSKVLEFKIERKVGVSGESFKRNLISLGQFDRFGYAIKLEGGTLEVVKGSMVVLKEEMKEGLY